ncbi:MAG: diaminopimelate epimerase, partial [Dehalococcoidales bacterium]
ADSLLVLLPSDIADFKMRTFYSDGTEAEICGNGIRCLALYVFKKGLISPGTDHLSLETIAGTRNIKLENTAGKLNSIQVGMGKPALSADEIPVIVKEGDNDIVDINNMLAYPVDLNGTRLLLNLVSMGNPHAIHFSDEPLVDFPMSKIGPMVEMLDIFPKRANFEVARVLNQNEIEVRVWERGVGETLACGTGACAVAVAAQLNGYVDHKVNIKLLGGTLKVIWEGTGEVSMNGPAEMVFTGEWPDENDSLD